LVLGLRVLGFEFAFEFGDGKTEGVERRRAVEGEQERIGGEWRGGGKERRKGMDSDGQIDR
jgi:hypothetical protein